MTHRVQQIDALKISTTHHAYSFPSNTLVKNNITFSNKSRKWPQYAVIPNDNFYGINGNVVSVLKEIFVGDPYYRNKLIGDYFFGESPTNCYIIANHNATKAILMFERRSPEGVARDAKSIDLTKLAPQAQNQVYVSRISISDLQDESFVVQLPDVEGVYTRASGGTTSFQKTLNSAFPRIDWMDYRTILDLPGFCWILRRDNNSGPSDPRGIYINTDINLGVNGWRLYKPDGTFISGQSVQADFEPTSTPGEGFLPPLYQWNFNTLNLDYTIKKIITSDGDIFPGNANAIPIEIRILFKDGRLFKTTAGIHGETDPVNFSNSIGAYWEQIASNIFDISWNETTREFISVQNIT